MIHVCNNLALSTILIGVINYRASAVVTDDPRFVPELQHIVKQIHLDNSDSERRRGASRDMLRKGRFKPTGRSKPANEYLLRTVTENGADGFPRINPVVDVANLFSLVHQTPLSLWDVDRSKSESFNFRYGLPGEQYVFNTAGQTIALEDLPVGCAILPSVQPDQPIVNPVKDSMATKTDELSRNFGIAVYASQIVFSEADVASLLQELIIHLGRVTIGGSGGSIVLAPGDQGPIQT
jgi:DNA/RNA-binding domain of Phe-tRNA-synthetase-like protein